ILFSVTGMLVTPSYSLTNDLNRDTMGEVITSASYVCPMNHVIHTKMSEGRRVAIPAELCQEYGLRPGTPVVLEPSESGIVLRPLAPSGREVQPFFADTAPPHVLLSEELSKDRREEAAREVHD